MALLLWKLVEYTFAYLVPGVIALYGIGCLIAGILFIIIPKKTENNDWATKINFFGFCLCHAVSTYWYFGWMAEMSKGGTEPGFLDVPAVVALFPLMGVLAVPIVARLLLPFIPVSVWGFIYLFIAICGLGETPIQ